MKHVKVFYKVNDISKDINLTLKGIEKVTSRLLQASIEKIEKNKVEVLAWGKF